MPDISAPRLISFSRTFKRSLNGILPVKDLYRTSRPWICALKNGMSVLNMWMVGDTPRLVKFIDSSAM